MKLRSHFDIVKPSGFWKENKTQVPTVIWGPIISYSISHFVKRVWNPIENLGIILAVQTHIITQITLLVFMYVPQEQTNITSGMSNWQWNRITKSCTNKKVLNDDSQLDQPRRIKIMQSAQNVFSCSISYQTNLLYITGSLKFVSLILGKPTDSLLKKSLTSIWSLAWFNVSMITEVTAE